MTPITEEYIRSIIKKRDANAHKGDFGKVLIFAGSVGMAGAAILCGRAALRSGAGLVRYLLPDAQSPLYPILQTAVPEATCVFADNVNLSEYTSIAAGPGLGKSEYSKDTLKKILTEYEGTIVLDADALNIISENPMATSANVIMTPHIGEARRLLKTDAITDREAAVKELSKEYNCVAVLKGAGTLVYKNELYINTTGNPGMATGGSGDVLTGLIAGLVSQGYEPEVAARLGVYLHGRAGDLAKEEKSEMGLIASDIAEFLPAAEKEVL